MLIKEQKKWMMPLTRLREPTRVCKLCFKELNENDLYHLNGGTNICLKCLNDLLPRFIRFKVDRYDAMAIFEYDDKVKSTLYQLKGCFDIEIADIYLDRFKRELRLMYEGYVMVPIPSYKEDDKVREFNHVIGMFKILKLPVAPVIVKTKRVKQASSNYKLRQTISKYLELKGGEQLKNKKVLLVDDVYTSGATMTSAVHLIETLHPKKMRVLVMSKTVLKPQNNE